MNKEILSGRMTKECELRQTVTGKMVTNFTLAVDRPYINNEGKHETDFFSVNAWRPAAKAISNYGYKGCKLLVEGNLQNRNYESQDGTKHYINDVVLQNFEFNSPKKDKTNGYGNEDKPKETPVPEPEAEPAE